MHASARAFFSFFLFPELSSLFLNSQPPPPPPHRFRMTPTPSKKSKATSPKRNAPSRSTRSRSLTPTRPSSASKKKKGEEEDDDNDDGEESEEEEEEDIQPTMEKREKKRRRSRASSSPSPSPSLPPVASNKRRMTMKKINEEEEEEDVSLTNAYAETNLVKSRFVKEFKARSERAMEAEEEAASLRVKLAESELRRVSAEAKALAMTKTGDGDGQTPAAAATTTAKGEGKTKRRSASPMVVSPTRRSTRATSADKELAENEENNKNSNAVVVGALVPTVNDENYYSPLMMKREIEARERAETERDKLREQLVALKTRHAALEKKVMDDEGDELEDEVKEENKIIEKLHKRLEKAETVNAELEMEVADLRGKRNERKAVEAKLEEALEVNEELKNSLEKERKSLLEKNNASNNNNNDNNNNNNKVLKELIEEKEHTIKILRQEMKSLEASAARGDMLHSKMVSVEAVEERLRSTEAKLSRAIENVRAKEIENENLQRAVKNAGKWSSALLEEGPEELKNRVGALQSETLSLSEKLAEATKALKVEQTKRELFESKAKAEEEAINALEKQLETAKMDALNAKSIVEAKDSEIASLQKMAENERKGEKILQMKSSPFTNEIIRGLEKEITKLKNSNNNSSNNRNNNNSSSSDEIIANLQKKEQRLLVAFKSTVLKFREAVKLLFGFNIELVGEKASKTQFLITSVANESATLLFNYDEAKHSVSLEKNDPSWERHSESLKKNFTLYVEKEEEDEKNSPGTTTSFGVPAFLSNWNMDMYNNTNTNN